MIAKPYYIKLNMMSKVLMLTSVQLTDSILKGNSDYSKMINGLDFEITSKYESLKNKLNDSDLEKALLLSLEEELCLYTNIYILAKYTHSDNFMDWFYEEMEIPVTNRLPADDREEATSKFYLTLTMMLAVIEDKLSSEESFKIRKKELNERIPLND